MTLKTIVTLLAGLTILSPAHALTQQAQDEIGRAALEYFKNNPESFMDVIQAVQDHATKKAQEQQMQKVTENKDRLFESGALIPTVGNPEGTKEIVVFMDPFCHYCRKFEQTIRETVAANKDVKIIARDIAIMHPKSIMLIKAMLAAAKQGKYAEMQSKLHKVTPEVTQDDINGIAKSLGLNVNTFKTDMEGKDIELQIKANMDLADALDINATPSFVVKGKDQINPGYRTTDQMKTILNG